MSKDVLISDFPKKSNDPVFYKAEPKSFFAAVLFHSSSHDLYEGARLLFRGDHWTKLVKEYEVLALQRATIITTLLTLTHNCNSI